MYVILYIIILYTYNLYKIKNELKIRTMFIIYLTLKIVIMINF